MFTHDSVADAQAQSGSLSHFFGCEERVKNTIDVFNSGSVIAEPYLDGSGVARRLHCYLPCTAGFTDGVVRIVQDVQEDLLQLVRISLDFGQGIFYSPNNRR